MFSRGRSTPTGRVVKVPVTPGRPGGAAGRYLPEDIAQMDRAPAPKSGPQSAAAHIARSIVSFPLEVVPPEGSVMFNPYGQAVTNAAGQVTVLWSFLVPASSLLIVKSIDLYATNTTIATQLAFGIFANGVPYGDFGSIPLFAGAATVNSRSFNDQTWRFLQNTLVTMQCTNTDGANYQVAASAQGWYYSTTIAEQFKLSVGAP